RGRSSKRISRRRSTGSPTARASRRTTSPRRRSKCSGSAPIPNASATRAFARRSSSPWTGSRSSTMSSSDGPSYRAPTFCPRSGHRPTRPCLPSPRTATARAVAGSVARTDVARRVAGDLAAVGIAVDVRERSLADLRSDIATGRFDLAIAPEDAADPRLASERWAGLVDPWFDILASAAVAAPERGEKRAIYAEMERLWASVLPALPLYQELRVDVAPQALADLQPPPSSAPLSWNVYRW